MPQTAVLASRIRIQFVREPTNYDGQPCILRDPSRAGWEWGPCQGSEVLTAALECN